MNNITLAITILCTAALAIELPQPVISIDFDNGYDASSIQGVLKGETGGAPKLVEGKFGKAVEVGQNYGYIDYVHPHLIKGNSGAIEMWLKRNRWEPDENRHHVFFENLNGDGWLVFYKFSAGSKMLLLSAPSHKPPYVLAPYTTGYSHFDHIAGIKNSPQQWNNDWAHFVGVWSEDGNRVYMNAYPGRDAPCKEFTPTKPNDFGTKFRIGDVHWNHGPDSNASTLIDSVRIYDQPLSADDVRVLYNNAIYQGKIPLDANLFHIDYAGDVDKRKINVTIHTGGADIDIKKSKVEVALVEEKTDPAKWFNFKITDSTHAKGNMKIPEKPGKYDIVVRVTTHDAKKVEIRNNIEMPDFGWIGNKLGMERKIQAPFETVKISGNNTVKVWGREYRFNQSALPEQIITRGEEMLATPIVINAKINGENVKWGKQKIKKITTDGYSAVVEATIAGKTRGDKIKIKVRSEIEFDGFCIFDVSSNKPEKFTEFSMHIPLRAERALYHHRYSTARLGCSGFVPAGTGVVDHAEFIPFTWMGDNDRGLFWCCESGEFWPNFESSDAYQELRSEDAKTVSMRFKLLADGQQFGKKWKYRFMLQATPVRPLPKNWRHTRYGLWERECMTKPYEQCIAYKSTLAHFNMSATHIVSTSGYPASSDVPLVKKHLEASRKLGIRLNPYINLTCFSSDVPEWAFFGNKWRTGTIDLDPSSTKRSAGVTVFNATDQSYRDFIIWKINKFMRETGYDTQYHDNSFPYSSALPSTGMGFEKNGIRYPSFNILATRELCRRNRAVMQDYRSDYISMAHMSSRVWAPILAYDDLMLFGENYRGTIKDTYCNGIIPMDKFRAEYMGRQWGLIPVMTMEPQKPYWKNTKTTRGIFTLAQLHDTFIWTPRGNIHVFNESTDHLSRFGYEDAEFIPYFDEVPPATSDIKNVYVSAYRKTNHDVLLFVGNISLKTANATITIDFKRLGVNPKSVIDHVSGKELKLDNNNLKLEIEDEGYRMLRIENSQVPEINIWG